MVGQARFEPALQPIYSPAFDDIDNRRQQTAAAALFQQLEGVPAADDHHLGAFNGGDRVVDAVDTGYADRHGRHNRSHFGRIIIPGLRHASEGDEYRLTAAFDLTGV